jgi:ribonuclease HI
MKEVWELPADATIKNAGKEWLLNLLHAIPLDQRARTLMVMWRIWHGHNELTHGKPCPPIEGSRRFLISYLNSLLLIKQWPEGSMEKGKMVVDAEQGFKKFKTDNDGRQKVRKRWMPPSLGKAKLNVDGAFGKVGEAGIGIALRDCQGDMIVAACREVKNCRDATESELMAIEEGLKISYTWTSMDITVETDCLEAAELIKESTPNTSIYAFRINVIRELLRERDSTLVKISRDCNQVSHELAQMGRCMRRTQVWLGNSPPEISQAMQNDCNSVIN